MVIQNQCMLFRCCQFYPMVLIKVCKNRIYLCTLAIVFALHIFDVVLVKVDAHAPLSQHSGLVHSGAEEKLQDLKDFENEISKSENVKAANYPSLPTWCTGGARGDYLQWDDYFMSVAFLSAMRSKDPNTQVGACIVNPERRIVGIGYNGFPSGCSDNSLPWCRTASHELDTKYPYVCHAEMNAILNKNSADVRGCTIYVALFPCADCAKLIIQSGISRIVYVSDKYHDTATFVASRRMLDLSGVKYHRHVPTKKSITIDFEAAERVTAEEAGTDGTV